MCVCPPTGPHHAPQHFAKAGVSGVQPGTGHHSDVELGAVGVWPSIGHAHPAGSVVTKDEVLISEVLTVNTVATSAIKVGEVTPYKLGSH